MRCPGHPYFERIGTQLFLTGAVDADVTSVSLAGYDRWALDPITVDTTAAPVGPTTRFFVVPLPEGTCFVTVEEHSSRPSAASDRLPQPAGPLPLDPDHARCTG